MKTKLPLFLLGMALAFVAGISYKINPKLIPENEITIYETGQDIPRIKDGIFNGQSTSYKISIVGKDTITIPTHYYYYILKN